MPSNDYDADATELLETYGERLVLCDLLTHPTQLELRNYRLSDEIHYYW
jgi:hypothetical protein